MRYNDGYYNFPDGRMDFQGGLPQPEWYMRMVGFSDDFYKPGQHYVRPAGVEAHEAAVNGVGVIRRVSCSVVCCSCCCRFHWKQLWLSLLAVFG